MKAQLINYKLILGGFLFLFSCGGNQECHFDFQSKMPLLDSNSFHALSKSNITFKVKLHSGQKQKLALFLFDSTLPYSTKQVLIEGYFMLGYDVAIPSGDILNNSSSYSQIMQDSKLLNKAIEVLGFERNKIILIGTNDGALVASVLGSMSSYCGVMIVNSSSRYLSQFQTSLVHTKTEFLFFQSDKSQTSNLNSTKSICESIPTEYFYALITSHSTNEDIYYDHNVFQQSDLKWPTMRSITPSNVPFKW